MLEDGPRGRLRAPRGVAPEEFAGVPHAGYDGDGLPAPHRPEQQHRSLLLAEGRPLEAHRAPMGGVLPDALLGQPLLPASGALPERKKFALTAFPVAMASAVMPFLSDAVDSFKDVRFSGLCLQAEHGILRLVGVASVAHVAALHIWMVQDETGAAELAEIYLGVTFASSEQAAESWMPQGVVFPEIPGKIEQLLYKQTTREKRRSLLRESLAQGAAAVVFQLRGRQPLEGRLVFASAFLMPVLQLVFATAAHSYLSRAVLPWILKGLSLAASTGNASGLVRFFRPFLEDGCWLLKLALEDPSLKAVTQGILPASAEHFPVLHAVAQLCDGHPMIDLGDRLARDQAALDAFFEVFRGSSHHEAQIQQRPAGREGGRGLGGGAQDQFQPHRAEARQHPAGRGGVVALGEAMRTHSNFTQQSFRRN